MGIYDSSAGDTDFRRKFTSTGATNTSAPIDVLKADKRAVPQNYEDAPLAEVLLSSRDTRVDFKSGLNKTQVVGSVSESGFHCQECNQTFKDSTGYLDHINSKRHLQNAGLGLRIEKSTAQQVEARILYWKEMQDKGVKEYNLQERVDKVLKDEAEKKEIKKIKDQERKQKRKADDVKDAKKYQLDDKMAKIMGLSGFGSSKK